jgi:hypothetical protein
MSLPDVLKTLSGAGTAITGWWKKSKGDVRSLIGELKDNLSYLDMVAEDDVPLGDVIEKISIAEFKRLAKEGFDFNVIRGGKISQPDLLEKTDLASWNGKTTEALIESIYDKIIDLKIRYPHVQQNTHYRWHARVNNIRKRIWLLFRHVGS